MTESNRPTHSATLSTLPLRAAQPDEFLPPIGQWATVGGVVLLGGFIGAVLLSAVLPYKVVVKAPASIRPSGELRLVQAAGEGKIKRIDIQNYQSVEAGQAIASIDDSRLQTQKQQLQASITQTQQQLQHNQSQIRAISQQIAAQRDQANRTVAAAEADLSLNQRTYRDRQISTVAEMQEAAAALTLAQEELTRYRALANTGAVAELQIREKAAAVQVATARLERMKAAINPSRAEVERAQARIAQEQAQGIGAIARLTQERAQLEQQRQDLEIKLSTDQKELQQIETELQRTVIRAPVGGVIQSLSLRNPDQVVRVGDTIAQIAPETDDLVVKALVSSQDIGKIALGQAVYMRVSACPYPDYGLLTGTIQAVSPDAVVPNSSSGSSAFDVLPQQRTYEVTIQPGQRALEGSQQTCSILPGMEGRADIVARQESVLQFMLRKARILADV